MPDALGNFTQQEQEKITNFLKEKGASFKPCELCGTFDWHFNQTSGGILPVGQNETIAFTSYFPVVLVVCANCRNTKIINLMGAGIFLGDPTTQKGQQQENAEKNNAK